MIARWAATAPAAARARTALEGPPRCALERLGRWALHGLAGAALASALAAVLTPGAHAQDIEAVAELRGLQLPASYYRTIQADPTAYTLPNGLFRTDGSGAQIPRAPASGTAAVPVVLALFADSDDPELTFSRDEIQRVLFDGPAPRGTITQAYEEMSRGAFTVTGDVLSWVRTSRPMAEVVGTENGFGSDADLGPYFTEALDLVDAVVDFGQYDNDGPDGDPNSGDDDGVVDAIVFEFLEVAGSCGGPSIWPHRWGLAAVTGEGPYRTDDQSANGDTAFVMIDGYITQGVSDCTGAALQNADVITHEYGHVLGLPDFYHWIDQSAGPRGRRWVLGCWGLMAAGSWGCGDVEDEGELRQPFGPTHMSARSKSYLGWVELTDPGEVWNEEIVLEPIQSSGVGLSIPLDDVGEEFLLVEYRERTGFDSDLPAAGVLFYKLDLTASLRPDPATSDPYHLMLLERDGNDGLLRTALEGGNRGEAGDAWGVEGVSGKLTYHSVPHLRLSAGGYVAAMVHEVHVDGGQARIVLSTGATPKLVPPDAPFEVMKVRTFSKPVRIAGGTGPYTGVGDLPEGFTLLALGDELRLVGSVTDEGPYTLSYAVRDGSGSESEPITVQLSAPIEWVVEAADLIDVFLDPGANALTPGEVAYLDDVGNANGQYDVGDLRRWLRESR